MKTVFLSGSRKISRLNDMIRRRIDNMIKQEFQIIIGDANGADKALQAYLAESEYKDVVIFCTGFTCRNNVGSWRVRNIEVAPMLTGRDFYMQKDKAMASEADFGFVLWDGKSAGAISNVFELLKRHKSVVVYFGPEKRFYTLNGPGDVQMLLDQCTDHDYRSISKKIQLDRRLADLGVSQQRSFSL